MGFGNNFIWGKNIALSLGQYELYSQTHKSIGVLHSLLYTQTRACVPTGRRAHAHSGPGQEAHGGAGAWGPPSSPSHSVTSASRPAGLSLESSPETRSLIPTIPSLEELRYKRIIMMNVNVVFKEFSNTEFHLALMTIQ